MRDGYAALKSRFSTERPRGLFASLIPHGGAESPGLAAALPPGSLGSILERPFFRSVLPSRRTPRAHKVDHSQDDGHDQYQMNQTTRHTKTPTQQPKDDENSEDGPKHRFAASR